MDQKIKSYNKYKSNFITKNFLTPFLMPLFSYYFFILHYNFIVMVSSSTVYKLFVAPAVFHYYIFLRNLIISNALS